MAAAQSDQRSIQDWRNIMIDEGHILGEKFLEFRDALMKEGHRGSVIVAAAMFDDMLASVLTARLVQPAESQDELLDGSHAPLCTFSTRIDLAYRVGAIGRQMRDSLHIVRKLRNEFAHVSDPINFSNQSVCDRIWLLLSRNRDLLEKLWGDMRPEFEMLYPDRFPPRTSPDLLRDFVKLTGYHYAFIFWASSVLSALALWGTELERLEERVVID